MANMCLRAMTLTAATASATGTDLENLSATAAHVIINITTLTGTAPTATFTVEAKDDSSGLYYTLLASTAIAATGTTVLKIGPSLTAAANSVVNDFVPKFFRVSMTAGGTITNLTATVGVNLING